ncbi:hypothetical protein UFOVP407_58 [uncultured Caudovirales phage]|uniref:Uncharacterized protein n=1 Tax=uncultured Caudovirales phage TaxID=2100421 RepID=A0A6J5M4R9_9CAUD|nr:hypothetical protein UFOVP407_58 [uncultured Caudovirales phage]
MSVPRAVIAQLAGLSPRLRAVLETSLKTTADIEAQQASQVAATDRLEQAAFLTLSANAELPNERTLLLGDGLVGTDGGQTFTLSLRRVARTQGSFSCVFNLVGDTSLVLPLTGQVATTGNIETLRRKTLDAPSLSGLGNYANDAAAATGGVPVGGMYRNGSALMVRVA